MVYSTRVLAVRHRRGPGSYTPKTLVKEYGTILRRVGKIAYLVQYDNTEKEAVGRHYIEIISKKSHFCNIDTGLFAWTVQEAIEIEENYVESKITIACPLLLDSDSWLYLKDRLRDLTQLLYLTYDFYIFCFFVVFK